MSFFSGQVLSGSTHVNRAAPAQVSSTMTKNEVCSFIEMVFSWQALYENYWGFSVTVAVPQFREHQGQYHFCSSRKRDFGDWVRFKKKKYQSEYITLFTRELLTLLTATPATCLLGRTLVKLSVFWQWDLLFGMCLQLVLRLSSKEIAWEKSAMLPSKTTMGESIYREVIYQKFSSDRGRPTPWRAVSESAIVTFHCLCPTYLKITLCCRCYLGNYKCYGKRGKNVRSLKWKVKQSLTFLRIYSLLTLAQIKPRNAKYFIYPNFCFNKFFSACSGSCYKKQTDSIHFLICCTKKIRAFFITSFNAFLRKVPSGKFLLICRRFFFSLKKLIWLLLSSRRMM